MKESKRIRAIHERLGKSGKYDVVKAVELLKEISMTDAFKVRFEESIDIAMHLFLKAKHSVRDMLFFPHRISMENKRVLVFADGAKAREAEEAGADYVGTKEYIEKIKNGWFDFDIVIAIPSMMKELGKLGSILGRKGLMPNPRMGTVTMDVVGVIKEFQEGKTEFKADKSGVVHLKVGRVSMEDKKLLGNIKAIYQAVLRKKPSDLKGEYIKSIAISSTMGPGLKIHGSSLI